MIGAIIGDIVGSPYEFNNTQNYYFPLFSDESEITDDTICTIAIADAILKGISYRDSLIHWCEKYPHPKGAYGASFSKWIGTGGKEPYNSYGNGAAMRISPIGCAFQGHRAIVEAIEATRVSHDHAEGLIGAIAITRAINELKILKNDQDSSIAHKKLIVSIIAKSYYGNDYINHIPSVGIFDETCQGCVPLAFYIIINSSSFEDAIRKAVSYGGDSDTLGAIVGAIAEEYFGIDATILRSASNFVPCEIKTTIQHFYHKYYSDARNDEIAPFFNK